MKKWLIILMCLEITGCAGLSANLNTGTGISSAGKQIMVFPFRNPNYKGQELTGRGDAVATAIAVELQKRGIPATVAPKESFPPTRMTNFRNACLYGKEKGADIVLVGVVSKWIDGATNWSGKRDFVGVTVTAYSVRNHKIIATVSAQHNCSSFTFVNHPANRLLPSLAQELVGRLFQ